jgi:hypothetical protein
MLRDLYLAAARCFEVLDLVGRQVEELYRDLTESPYSNPEKA